MKFFITKNKSKYKKFIVFAFFMLISFSLYPNVNPGTNFDLNAFINSKLDAGEKTITIPPGRYRVLTNSSEHIYLANRNDVTIIADGVEMICTETVQAIKIENCNNLTIQGLSVDYDPLPFTQGVITDISSDNTQLSVRLLDGYSDTVIREKLEIYNPNTGLLSTATYYGISYNPPVNRTLVITKDARNWDSMVEKVGDIVVLDSQGSRRIPHTIRPINCTNLTLENITVYAGTSFAFFETYCSNSKYINCKVDRRPFDDKIKEREVMRMRSNNADAFHSKYAEIGPSYIGCTARYNGDDGFAINGDFHIVTETNGDLLTVVGKGGIEPQLYVDDAVELVSYNGERLPDAKILNIEIGRALNTTEKTFLNTQKFFGEADQTENATNVYFIKIDRSVNLPLGSLINAANRIGNNFEVKNCIVGPNRSRGILVKSSHGVIDNNNLEGNWGEGIKLAPEYVWLEAGSGSDIVVSNNTINACHGAAIAVVANSGSGNVAPIGAHDNIKLINNSISNSSNPGIAITSTSNLCRIDNTILSPNNDFILPWQTNTFERNEDPSREIYLKNVSETVCDNSFSKTKNILKKNIRIYPNPTNEILNIIFEDEFKDSNIKIFDISGKVLLERKLEKTNNSLSLDKFAKGIYLLKINKNGKLIDKLIVKQ